MKALEVYYHFFIPDQPQIARNFHMWLDAQLQNLVKSRIQDHAKINMCITMPVHWNNHGLDIRDNTHYNIITFQEKIKEYVDFRYPFVNIIDVRDSSYPNIFEGQTLKCLYDKCKNKDMYVLYFHNKGIFNSKISANNWREILEHFLISKWKDCLKLLEDHDVVGVKDIRGSISGNFFWADSYYIHTLQDPLEVENYSPEDLNTPTYRYAFEKWIKSGNPNIYDVYDTKTCHYSNYFIRELLEFK